MVEMCIRYISENQVLIQTGLQLLLFLVLLFTFMKVASLKKQVAIVCKNVQKYFEAIVQEEEEEEARDRRYGSMEERVVSQGRRHERYREDKRREDGLSAAEKLQQEKDAKIVMDVISDVF